MKKKIHPKDQTKELSRALWEFMRRNPEACEKYERSIHSFREDYEKSRKEEIELLNAHPEMGELNKRLGIKPMQECDEYLSETYIEPAAKGGSVVFWRSWMKIMWDFKPHPLHYSNEEKHSRHRDQILLDARKIVERLLFKYPSKTSLIAVDLNRSKEAIMADVEKIIDEDLDSYKKELSKIYVLGEDGKVIDIERDDKRERMKWLPIVDELLEVWDLWALAGQKPWQRSMTAISRKVGRPVSTVKTQWRMAYEKIHGKPYDPQTKYVNEEKRANADTLCANCPHGAKCYTRGDWYPCADYRKLTGKERAIKTVEYTDGIKND